MSLEPFIGEIKLFAFDFEPRGYTFCNGQIMAIAQNTALFSLIGVKYGGNGTTTFQFPDLRGRMAVGQGQGSDLSVWSLGEDAGFEANILSPMHMPVHNHTLSKVSVKMPANNTLADIGEPAGVYPGLNRPNQVYAKNPTKDVSMARAVVSGATAVSGNSTPLNILNPRLVMNYCIASQGIFPSRN